MGNSLTNRQRESARKYNDEILAAVEELANEMEADAAGETLKSVWQKYSQPRESQPAAHLMSFSPSRRWQSHRAR